jgi:hypothetical protein
MWNIKIILQSVNSVEVPGWCIRVVSRDRADIVYVGMVSAEY